MATLEPSSLRISYRHAHTLAEITAGAAQRWCYEARAADFAGAEVRVGRGTAILVDLYGPDPYGSLDPFGPRVHRIRAAAMDRSTGELGSWGDELDMCGDRLVILSALRLADAGEVEVRDGLRALAPLVSAMAMSRMGHCAVAALYAPWRAGGRPSGAGRDGRGGLRLHPAGRRRPLPGPGRARPGRRRTRRLLGAPDV